MNDQHRGAPEEEVAPPLPPDWPLDEFQLAGLVSAMHWELEQVAFDLPRRKVGRGRLDQVASDLERMAYLLRQHNVDDSKALSATDEERTGMATVEIRTMTDTQIIRTDDAGEIRRHEQRPFDDASDVTSVEVTEYYGGNEGND